MPFGKLTVVKAIGNRMVFSLFWDKDEKATIPNIEEWLFERIGHDITLDVTNTHFIVADVSARRREEGKDAGD